MSRRTERVASLIRSILADAIQSRLSDPRIEPLTSITRVEVSADMSAARVHVSVMAPAPRRKLTVEALGHAAGRLRSMMARELALRQTPQLDFRLDESLQHGFDTVRQLDRIMEELGGGLAGAEGDRECLDGPRPSPEVHTGRTEGAGGIHERREGH